MRKRRDYPHTEALGIEAGPVKTTARDWNALLILAVFVVLTFALVWVAR